MTAPEAGPGEPADAGDTMKGRAFMGPNTQTVVLVPSPFLGPSSLRPLAEALEAAGVATLVPDLRAAVTGEPVHRQLVAEFAAALHTAAAGGPLVVVGHSGAGPLLPAFAQAAERRAVALVYLDAELPTPGKTWEDTAPAELVDELRSRARNSRLPPWHRWFDADLLAELVPDDELRESLIEEEPEVAAGFLTEARPDVDWAGPSGYIQLGPPYAGVAARAAEKGWPVRRIDTHHLAPVTQPTTLADALLDVLTALNTK